ncbi:MAG: hypothetical protein U9N61_01620 [Euryarchaeota archaeon]|nr:hypothetical protein [Euryarchaeota archaeon]
MNFKNVENVEKYAGIFSRVGDRKISPVEFYDAMEIPRELRATFTVIPFNPIVLEEVKEINKAGRRASDKWLEERGFNVFDISKDITDIRSLFLAVADAENETDRELLNTTAKDLVKQVRGRANNTNSLKSIFADYNKGLGDPKKSDNYDYAFLSLALNKFKAINEEQDGVYYAKRDLARLFDIVIAHTSKVENLITQNSDGELESHNGDFTATQLYSLPRDILKWLEAQLGRESSLSELEIVGL